MKMDSEGKGRSLVPETEKPPPSYSFLYSQAQQPDVGDAMEKILPPPVSATPGSQFGLPLREGVPSGNGDSSFPRLLCRMSREIRQQQHQNNPTTTLFS